MTDVHVGPGLDDGRHLIRLLVGEIDRQALLDRFQVALDKSENWHIVMFPMDVVVPREPKEEKKPTRPRKKRKRRNRNALQERNCITQLPAALPTLRQPPEEPTQFRQGGSPP